MICEVLWACDGAVGVMYRNRVENARFRSEDVLFIRDC